MRGEDLSNYTQYLAPDQLCGPAAPVLEGRPSASRHGSGVGQHTLLLPRALTCVPVPVGHQGPRSPLRRPEILAQGFRTGLVWAALNDQRMDSGRRRGDLGLHDDCSTRAKSLQPQTAGETCPIWAASWLITVNCWHMHVAEILVRLEHQNKAKQQKNLASGPDIWDSSCTCTCT